MVIVKFSQIFHTTTKSHSSSLGPLFVDFGEVCLQSVCLQRLEMTNNLSAFVWVQLEVDCPELQGSSPLSHILPPHSQSTLLLMFQSNRLGHFYRWILKAVLQHKNWPFKSGDLFQVQH